MALTSQDEPVDDALSGLRSEPLVPILQVGAGQIDPVALATWHQALSNTVAVEVPHDLMGLWLYPSQGGASLLGPTELAADDLPVPIPSPHLTSEQLSAIEKIVRDAGYGSVTCLPIRFGKRDVALMLVANLQRERYGPAERVLLQCVARKVAPMLGRIARQWGPVEATSTRQQERIAGLLEAVAQANRDAAGPQRFLTASIATRPYRAAFAECCRRPVLPSGRAWRWTALGRSIAGDQPGASGHRRDLQFTNRSARVGCV
jgi:hypothetical protein